MQDQHSSLRLSDFAIPQNLQKSPTIITTVNFITPDTVELICPVLTTKRSTEIAVLINKVVHRYGLDNIDIFEEFFATIIHESNYFTNKVENLNYSAQGLANTWPTRFAVDPKAKVKVPNKLAWTLHRKPEQIANTVYANRMGNGDESSGDGWKHRGVGFIQITGKEVQSLYAKYIGKSLDDTLFLLHTDEFYCMDSAAWYFCVYKSLKDEAERDDFVGITKAVNGGYIGMPARLELMATVRKYLK